VRTLLGLAAAGAMAAAAAIAPLTTSSAAVHPERADSVRAAAVQALQSHAVAARAGAGTGFVARSVRVDRDGSTHVRVDRTYFGLPVLGGDLVVHQGAAGGWAGASQTLRAPLTLGTTASVADAAAVAAALRLRPAAPFAEPRSKPRHAWSSTPVALPRGSPGRSSPAGSRPTGHRAGWRRTSMPAAAD